MRIHLQKVTIIFYLKIVKKILEELKLKYFEFKNELDSININIKNLKFDPLPITINKEEVIERSSEDWSSLILSLEHKLTAKFSIFDERLTRAEDEIKNLKKLENVIKDVRNSLLVIDEKVFNNKEQISILFGKFEDLKIFTQNLNDKTDSNNLQHLEKFKNIKIYFDEKFYE
jgi:hypothetical protein